MAERVREIEEEMLTEGDVQKMLWWDFRSSSRILMPNFTPQGWWECDIWRVTNAGWPYEYEIKLNRQDFRADAKKERKCWRTGVVSNKHRLMSECPYPRRFYYVLPIDIGDVEIPDWAGTIWFTDYNGRAVRRGKIDQGPGLGETKATEAEIKRALTSAYYRFWDGRVK